MSQNNSNDKAAALAKLDEINKIDGFDPSGFAVDYSDLTAGGEIRKHLPVMIQIAWFRLKYPEGKITVNAEPNGDCFVATARIYPNYKDPEYAYLAEATASRGNYPEKPSISPREWAQTAAIGVALRNAGFGLQFDIAGEDFADIAPDELTEKSAAANKEAAGGVKETPESAAPVPIVPPKELTPEEKYRQAILMPCPINKYNGKTLGDVLTLDPKALTWIAEKFTGDEKIRTAARTICEYAAMQAAG